MVADFAVSSAFDSGRFWERRYARGGTSGSGSYGILASYKASFLNRFVSSHAIQSVIEFGCGDGNQLSLSTSTYPHYLGFDVSSTVLARLRQRFAHVSTFGFQHVSLFNASLPAHTAELKLMLRASSNMGKATRWLAPCASQT